jgi:hypothetical protein
MLQAFSLVFGDIHILQFYFDGLVEILTIVFLLACVNFLYVIKVQLVGIVSVRSGHISDSVQSVAHCLYGQRGEHALRNEFTAAVCLVLLCH